MYSVRFAWQYLWTQIVAAFLRLYRPPNRKPLLGLLAGFCMGMVPITLTGCGGIEILEGDAHAQHMPGRDWRLPWPSKGTNSPTSAQPSEKHIVFSNDTGIFPNVTKEQMIQRIFGLLSEQIAPIQAEVSYFPRLIPMPDSSSSMYRMRIDLSDYRLIIERKRAHLPVTSVPNCDLRFLEESIPMFQEAAKSIAHGRQTGVPVEGDREAENKDGFQVLEQLVYEELVALAKEGKLLPIPHELGTLIFAARTAGKCNAATRSPGASPAPARGYPASEEPIPAFESPYPEDFLKKPLPTDIPEVEACIKNNPMAKDNPEVAEMFRAALVPMDPEGRAQLCQSTDKPFVIDYANLIGSFLRYTTEKMIPDTKVKEHEAAALLHYQQDMKADMPTADELKRMHPLLKAGKAAILMATGTAVRLRETAMHPLPVLASLIKPDDPNKAYATRDHARATLQDPNRSWYKGLVARMDIWVSYPDALAARLDLARFSFAGRAAEPLLTPVRKMLSPVRHGLHFWTSVVKLGASLVRSMQTQDPAEFAEIVSVGGEAGFFVIMTLLPLVQGRIGKLLEKLPSPTGYILRAMQFIQVRGISVLAKALDDLLAAFTRDLMAMLQRLEDKVTKQLARLAPSSEGFLQQILSGDEAVAEIIPPPSALQRSQLERLGNGLIRQMTIEKAVEPLRQSGPETLNFVRSLVQKQIDRFKSLIEKVRTSKTMDSALAGLRDLRAAFTDLERAKERLMAARQDLVDRSTKALEEFQKDYPTIHAQETRHQGRKIKPARPLSEPTLFQIARTRIEEKLTQLTGVTAEIREGIVQEWRTLFRDLNLLHQRGRIVGWEVWVKIHATLRAVQIVNNFKQLKIAIKMIAENPGKKIALTVGEEPVLWKEGELIPLPKDLLQQAVPAAEEAEQVASGSTTAAPGKAPPAPREVSSSPTKPVAEAEGGKPGVGGTLEQPTIKPAPVETPPALPALSATDINALVRKIEGKLAGPGGGKVVADLNDAYLQGRVNGFDQWLQALDKMTPQEAAEAVKKLEAHASALSKYNDLRLDIEPDGTGRVVSKTAPLPEGIGLDLVDPLETPSSSYALGKALDAGGHVRAPGWVAHHMVAGNAEAAAPAREVLKRFGIGINEEVNGAYLPGNTNTPNPTGAAVHSRVHTNKYYQTVNKILEGATSRASVEARLAIIRQKLLSGGL